MRILLLTMNPNLGASARTLQDWLLLARENGIDPVICLRTEGELSRWLAEHGFDIHVNPMPLLDGKNALKWTWSAGRLLAWLRRRRVDVLHCYEHDLWPFAWPLRNVMRVPAICHFHFSVRPKYSKWAFGSKWRRPNHAIWTSQQQKIDSSAAVAGLMPAEGESVVPLGLDLSRFGQDVDAGIALRQRLGFGNDEIVIGSACALRNRKRVDDFIDLIVKLTTKHTHVKGLLAGGPVAGEEEYGTRVSQRLRKLEATGKLRWLGHMEPVEPLFHASDIFVSTSEYETFGMSVLEAMACSRPIAAYRGGSVGEIVGNAGLIVETGDLAALTDAVEKLVVHDELRLGIGHAGRLRVAEEFNPQASFCQLAMIYGGLIGQRKVRVG